jgi:predicted ATPase
MDVWPATLAPIAQVLREGLDLGPVTVLVGANGSGKSTLVEGVVSGLAGDESICGGRVLRHG